MSFDAMVIGAGVNGLAAAIQLADKGWKVAVVEAASTPGGAVKTREATLPGFRHDLCAMNLSMFAGSAFHAKYGDALMQHGLELVPAPDCFASVFRDGSSLGVSSDPAKTAAAIEAISPQDVPAWQAMQQHFGKNAPHIFGLMGSPIPSWRAGKALWGAWRQLGTAGLYDLARLFVATPRDFLDRHFAHPKLKAMMAAWGLHVDFAPDIAGGALFPYLESMSNQAFGMVIGKGGADVIIRAMTALFESKGGQLLLDSQVTGIDTHNGAATGVRLADGRALRAKRAVIANVHPRLVFGGLLPKGTAPTGFEDQIAAFRSGPAAMMIHLAMDGLPDWTAGDDLKKFAYVHIAPDLAMMSRVYAEASDGLLPAEPAIVVGQPTALDPERAPAGRHVLWIQVRVVPAEIRGDALGRINATNWDEAREAYADRVLDIIEGYAPGFRARILGRSVFSPRDLEHENPNLIGGDSIGGSHHLDQNFIFRPVPGHSRYATPVKSLYLCGASTWPGAGTGAGSGFMLGELLAR